MYIFNTNEWEGIKRRLPLISVSCTCWLAALLQPEELPDTRMVSFQFSADFQLPQFGFFPAIVTLENESEYKHTNMANGWNSKSQDQFATN